MYEPKGPRPSGLAAYLSKKTIYDLPEPGRTIMHRVVDLTAAAYDVSRPKDTYDENGRHYCFHLPHGPGARDFTDRRWCPSRRDRIQRFSAPGLDGKEARYSMRGPALAASERDDRPAAYRDYARAIEDRQRAGRSLGPLCRDPRNGLIARHLYLPGFLVSKFLQRNFEFAKAKEDKDNLKCEEIREALLCAAHEAMARAAIKFKPERGTKFYSYAFTAIQRALLAEQTKRAEWASLIGDELDAPVGDDDGTKITLIDLVIDDTGADNPVRIVAESVLPHFEVLTDRERYVIFARHSEEEPTQQELAAKLGCSSQNVSLIEQRALAKLREAITGRKDKPSRKPRQRRETSAIPQTEQLHDSSNQAALAA